MTGAFGTGVKPVPLTGILVVGMPDCGVDHVGNVLHLLGLPQIDAAAGRPLARFNDRLLRFAGGTLERLPELSPDELVRVLDRFRIKAGQTFQAALPAEAEPTTWVWSDPRLSVLAPFWWHTLDLDVAVVFVHRDPADLTTSIPRSECKSRLEQWDHYNRAAMAQAFQRPSAVFDLEQLLNQAKGQVQLIVEFIELFGLSVPAEAIEASVDYLENAANGALPAVEARGLPVSKDQRTLAHILTRMDGIHPDPRAWTGDKGILDEIAGFYDEDYYGTSYDISGIPYARDQEHWVSFFNGAARSIVATLHPRSALDVGCATGMLVEALRNEGVDAQGIDISEWAIGQVPAELAPYCTVGSVTEELDGHYDLITFIEVAEHLPAFAVDEAIANLCRHAECVFFSSTPDDFDEPTHLNVQSSGYWALAFLRHGFIRDFDYDASFLAPHAILFRRTTKSVEEVVYDYELALADLRRAAAGRDELDAARDAAVAEHDALADRYNTLVRDNQSLMHEFSRVSDQLYSQASAFREERMRRQAELTAAVEEISAHNVENHRLHLELQRAHAEIQAIHHTKTFRYLSVLRRAYGKLRRLRTAPAISGGPVEVPEERTYARWVERYDTLDDATRAAVRARLDTLEHYPLVSVIMPVYNTPARYLKAALESVLAQLYTNWELCVADDCSTEPHVAGILAQYAKRDARIKVVTRSENGHIAAASNSALEIATGDWIVPLDHDDVLTEHALALGMLAWNERRDARVIYSDEDKIDDQGQRQLPYFKPDFDPLLLLAQNYMTHLLFLRRDLVGAVGGYRVGFEGSQDWDLVLRVAERIEEGQVVHVPHVLYHWRLHDESTASLVSNKPYALDAGRRAVVEHLARSGLDAEVTRIPSLGHNRVRWRLPESPPLVSIIIPTKDGALLRRCIDSLLELTSYPSFEIVVVDNGSRGLATLEFLRENEQHLTVIRDERPFNYSALNNAAVRRAKGDVLCLLNDDTEVIAPHWLDEMVGHLLMPHVGAVGAKLYYPDGRIQHAGVIVGLGGVAGHSHRMSDRLSPGYNGRLLAAQNLSAVTGACMVVRREAWELVGGLDEGNLAIAFNDVDFGLRLRQAGWRVVWTPYATLFHHESISRGPDDIGPRVHGFAKEIQFIKDRWGESLLRDPAYNPNLTLDTEDFALSWPPRVSYR